MEGAGNCGEILDLLRKFTKIQSECPEKNKRQKGGEREREREKEEEEEGEDMELSLGLSMNGRFGVDPTGTKKLKRSSSSSTSTANAAPAGGTGAALEADAPLSRTRSLPVETEEEWRRRKELQSMRRMEARKKRMEKLKNLRVPRAVNGGKNGPHQVVNGDSDGHRSGKRIHRRLENGEVIESSSQGSIGPLRSGSSGSSDLTEGGKQSNELSPSSRLQISNGLEPSGRASEREEAKAPINQQMKKSTMHHDMPYVTTKETGPNGRKVEGFLYGYKRGEDVRIMCVCHGLFLSPKEFIEHGGVRGEVEHPLKHIVVNPFPLL